MAKLELSTDIHPFIRIAQDRLLARMDVSPEDADFAAQILSVFFYLKTKNPKLLLILPQIPDWAWHEMVADTRGYREFWQNQDHVTVDEDAVEHVHFADHSMWDHTLFADHSMWDHSMYPGAPAMGSEKSGEVIQRDHISAPKTKSGQEIFLETTKLFREEFGIDYLSYGWTDSGWGSPAYRLRDPDASAYAGFKLTVELASALDAAEKALSDHVKSLDASWIQDRLLRRYPVSADAARLIYISWLVLFDERRDNFRPMGAMPAVLDFAFFEHVLHTCQYRSDCTAMFDEFLDRPAYKVVKGEAPDDAADVLAVLKARGLGDAVPLLGEAGWATV